MTQNVIYWKIENNNLYIRGESSVGYDTWDIPNTYSYSSIPWYDHRTTIEYVIIETPIDVTTMKYWFRQQYNLTSINDSNNIPIVHISSYIYNVTDMSYCFEDCSFFDQPITIPNSVTNMHNCFYACESLNSTVSFETISKVSEMDGCFCGCESFNQPITIPNSVTSMSSCFYSCDSLNSTVSFEPTSRVTDMTSCFEYCYTFNQSITIPNSVTYMNNCFYCCASFNKPITIPNNVTHVGYCFQGCTNLNTIITINKSDQFTVYSDMFYGTQKDIYIRGKSPQLESIANEYSNVYIKKSILYRALHYLQRLNAECDYFIRIVNTRTILSPSTTSNLSGVTISSAAVWLIGNYLSYRVVLTLNSSAQSTISTGNVTNRNLCTVTIPDIYYSDAEDYESMSNADRFNKIRATASYSQAVASGTSSGNAQPAAFVINREISNHDLKVNFFITANIVSTTQYELTVILPVTRIPFKYAEI